MQGWEGGEARLDWCTNTIHSEAALMAKAEVSCSTHGVNMMNASEHRSIRPIIYIYKQGISPSCTISVALTQARPNNTKNNFLGQLRC